MRTTYKADIRQVSWIGIGLVVLICIRYPLPHDVGSQMGDFNHANALERGHSSSIGDNLKLSTLFLNRSLFAPLISSGAGNTRLPRTSTYPKRWFSTFVVVVLMHSQPKSIARRSISHKSIVFQFIVLSSYCITTTFHFTLPLPLSKCYSCRRLRLRRRWWW